MNARSSARELFFGLSVDMLCIADRTGVFVDVNEAWTRTMGWTPEELCGAPFVDFVHPDDVERTLHEAMALNEGHETVHFENRYRCRDGSFIWVSWKAAAQELDDGESLTFAVARDVTEEKRREEALRHLADHDGLTGLWCRRRFEQEVEKQVARCRRYGESAALFLLDIDHFKDVNDRHGHAAGDELLKHVASALRERLRASDSVARLGGDEFAVLLPHLAPDDAAVAAEAIAEHLRDAPFAFGGSRIPVVASAGVAFLDKEAISADDVMLEADRAMYDAKASGRDSRSGLRRPHTGPLGVTRFFHCDDSTAYRRLLAEMLSAHRDFLAAGGAESLVGALPAIKAAEPDVILLDVMMSGGGAASGVEAIRAAAPRAAILVLSGLETYPEHLAAITDGFVSKRSTSDAIADAIRHVTSAPVGS